VASKYSDDPRNLPKGSSAVLALGWRWFQQLKLTRTDATEPVSLYELQTYCVCTFSLTNRLNHYDTHSCQKLEIYFLKTSNSNESTWVLLGWCMRLAHERGLHRRRNPTEKPTLERELWKRAFWFLLANNTLASIALGRPSATTKDE
jgi:hypothetical protein